MKKKKPAIIVDIDYTISDPGDRINLVKDFTNPNDPNWTPFYDKVIEDTPLYDTITFINNFKNQIAKYLDISVIILTSRDEISRKKTKQWLKKHNIPCDLLLMRPYGDCVTPDFILKKQIYNQTIKPFYDILLVIDDRKSILNEFKKIQLPCLLPEAVITGDNT